MANFSSIKITNVGKELIKEIQNNKETLIFTKMVISSASLSVNDIPDLTAMTRIQQSSIFNYIKFNSESVIELEATFKNELLKDPFNLRAFGIYGKTETMPETLIGVSVLENSNQYDYITETGNLTGQSITIKATLLISGITAEAEVSNLSDYLQSRVFINRSTIEDDAINEINLTRLDNLKTTYGIRLKTDGITLNALNIFNFDTGDIDEFIDKANSNPTDYISKESYTRLLEYIDDFNKYKVPMMVGYSNQVIAPQYYIDENDSFLTHIKMVVNLSHDDTYELDFSPFGIHIIYDTENDIPIRINITNILEGKLAGQLGTLMRSDYDPLKNGVYAFSDQEGHSDNIASTESIEVLSDWRNADQSAFINSFVYYDGGFNRYCIDVSTGIGYIQPPWTDKFVVNAVNKFSSGNTAISIRDYTLQSNLELLEKGLDVKVVYSKHDYNLAYGGKMDYTKSRIIFKGIKMFKTLSLLDTVLANVKEIADSDDGYGTAPSMSVMLKYRYLFYNLYYYDNSQHIYSSAYNPPSHLLAVYNANGSMNYNGYCYDYSPNYNQNGASMPQGLIVYVSSKSNGVYNRPIPSNATFLGLFPNVSAPKVPYFVIYRNGSTPRVFFSRDEFWGYYGDYPNRQNNTFSSYVRDVSYGKDIVNYVTAFIGDSKSKSRVTYKSSLDGWFGEGEGGYLSWWNSDGCFDMFDMLDNPMITYTWEEFNNLPTIIR